MTTIAIQVISEEYGENKCLELLELIKEKPHLFHVGFRRFNDGKNCLMLCLTADTKQLRTVRQNKT